MGESPEVAIARLDERSKAQDAKIESLTRIVYGLLITSATMVGNAIIGRLDFGKDEAVAVPPAALSFFVSLVERLA